jgi:hypothetical protein
VCGAVHDPDRQPKPRRPGPAIKEEPALVSRIADQGAASQPLDEDLVEAEQGDLDIEDLEESDAEESNEDELSKEGGELIEDTSELGEDDDDIGEVMEHVDDELDDKA